MTQATPHQRDLAGESWNPGQYLKFADHRLRPALDLMGRIPLEDPQVIYDLGCGSGNVTRLLADRWPGADVIGMDNSPEMLAQAAAGRCGTTAPDPCGGNRETSLIGDPTVHHRSFTPTPCFNGSPIIKSWCLACGRCCLGAGAWRCRYP